MKSNRFYICLLLCLRHMRKAIWRFHGWNRRTVLRLGVIALGGLVVLSLLFVACKAAKEKQENTFPFPLPTATPENEHDPAAGPTFAGLSSVGEVTTTTATLQWEAFEDAIGYQIFYLVGEAELWTEGEVVGPDVFSYVMTGLTPDTTYTFNVQALLEEEGFDGNIVTQSVRTMAFPEAPTAITIKSPVLAVGFNRTPTFTVSGVEAGATVRLYKDNTCTAGNLVASGVVENAKTSIDLTISTLSADPANYSFYATATNPFGDTSPCSSASASYQIVACPNEMYVPVEGNPTLGTSAFCVMKTEAKQGENNIPVSQYASVPWVSISAINAKAACKSIVVENGSCDIISNSQWMTIARDIEATAANWSNGAVGDGFLSRGHAYRNPGDLVAITNPADPYDSLNNSPTWKRRRMHVLSNGGEIWDLAGNAREWVDWETGGDTFSLGPTTCSNSYQDPFAKDCADLRPEDYLPANPAKVPADLYTNTNCGFGAVAGTSDANRANAGAAQRGGRMNHGDYAGIFYLIFDSPPTYTATDVGFRCVCTVTGA